MYSARHSTVPFQNVEDAWFWFMKALAAQEDGAMARKDLAETPRPCEPSDILNAVDRLYQRRILMIDHMRVLIHYGRRFFPPNPRRSKEEKSHVLWRESMNHLEPVLRGKGIIE